MKQAYVLFDGWAGRTKHRVTILKELPKSYKVRLEESAYRYPKHHVLYPPKGAVQFEEVL